MTPDARSSADLARWVAAWREAGPALARQRLEEIERLETMEAVARLADLFDHAVRNAPRTLTSGLVEQQRLFQRLPG